MQDISLERAIQGALKGITRRIKDILPNVSVLKIRKSGLIKNKYTLKLSNGYLVNFFRGKIAPEQGKVIRVDLKEPKVFNWIFNKKVIQRRRRVELLFLTMGNALKTGNMSEALRFFGDSGAIFLLYMIKNKYEIKDQELINLVRSKLDIVDEGTYVRSNLMVPNQISILKILGSVKFVDKTDYQPVLEGLAQGIALKEFPPDKVIAFERLKAVIGEFNKMYEADEELKRYATTYYTVYGISSILMEEELIKSISRIAALNSEMDALIHTLESPSLESLYKSIIGEDFKFKSSYQKILSLLPQDKWVKVGKELRYVKLQERKYKRFLIITLIAEKLGLDESVIYPLRRFTEVALEKYNEFKTRTAEYIIRKGLLERVEL
ncbi:MAG: hypothetical protein ACTSPL_06200 [Candidatus Odinarchaeia archaeon]